MAKAITWQDRGIHLALCCGLTPKQFADGIDGVMTGNIQGTVPKPAKAAGPRKYVRRKPRATAGATT